MDRDRLPIRKKLPRWLRDSALLLTFPLLFLWGLELGSTSIGRSSDPSPVQNGSPMPAAFDSYVMYTDSPLIQRVPPTSPLYYELRERTGANQSRRVSCGPDPLFPAHTVCVYLND